MDEGGVEGEVAGLTPLFGSPSPDVEQPAKQVATADAGDQSVSHENVTDVSMSSNPENDSDLYDSSEHDVDQARESADQLSREASERLHTVSRKRKSIDSMHDSGMGMSSSTVSKRLRQASNPARDIASTLSSVKDRSLISAEIWHHVFTFCPPSTLGNLLQVNKLFNRYLDSTSSVQKDLPTRLARTAVEPLRPEHIWQISRRRFWPSTPSPLESKSQLEMWRIAYARRCQWCGKQSDQSQSMPPDSFRGPGPHGVTVVWQFATATCGPCLLQKSLKVGTHCR
jgi:hypothetical protein